VIAALVLAAGAGSRYDGVKQLHPVDGRPMLERVVLTVADAPVSAVVVVLGARAAQVAAHVNFGGALVVVCPHWSEGQAASLQCGIAALAPEISAALVVLGDGPELAGEALRRIIAAHRDRPDSVLAADYGTGRSHPVVLPRGVWSQLPASGETPGRTLSWEAVDCADLAAPGDVDYSS
jgi:CTP:molybdopterin cytidylyltransferase MocA